MQRVAAWVFLSAGALAVLAGCVNKPAVKPAAPLAVLSIEGALSYRERIALPPDSIAVVELREAASVEPIAAQRIPLNGKQVPIPFALTASRAALPAGKTYSVRGAIEQAGQVSWVSAAVAIDPQHAAIDLGMLNLQAVQGREPERFSWRCGDRLVDTVQIGSKQRLTLDNSHFNLRQIEAASGARYEAIDDSSTSFWSKGTRARLTLKGKAYPECVRADTPAAAFRASGNEPGWHLEMGSRTRFNTADGAIHIDVLTPAAETAATSRRYALAPGLQVTVVDRLCVDTMSGMPHPNRVTIWLNGPKLHGCGGDPSALLQGGEWRVVDIAGTGIVDGSHATLNFGADGQLTGSGSCNRYSGRTTLTGEGLTVSAKTAMTLMACVPELMQQERRFMQLLEQTRRFRFDKAGALILETDGKGRLTARRL